VKLLQGTPVLYCSNVPTKFNYLCRRFDAYDGQGTCPTASHGGESLTNPSPPQRHGWPTKPRSCSTKSRLQPHGACQTPTSGLHAVTYPKWFPTNTSKVAFTVSFMRDYAATWSQLYLDKVFHKVPVVFYDFLNNFRSSFFDQNRQQHAEVALRNLCQTGTMLAYTQDFNQHTCTMGWADAPLMSLYQHGLKENIQLAMFMRNIDLNSLRNSTRPLCPPPIPSTSTSTPTPDPNVMELSEFQKAPKKQISDAERACWVQRNLCFCWGQASQISCRCLNKG
ncbi:uncharacterized protein VP01_6078g1, partial [Puccinia sorghi]